eukprot:sb/3478546/
MGSMCFGESTIILALYKVGFFCCRPQSDVIFSEIYQFVTHTRKEVTTFKNPTLQISSFLCLTALTMTSNDVDMDDSISSEISEIDRNSTDPGLQLLSTGN